MLFRSVSQSRYKPETPIITIFQTLSVLRIKYITKSIVKKIQKDVKAKNILSTLTASGIRQKFGTQAKRVLSGIENTAKKLWKAGLLFLKNAKYAEMFLKQNFTISNFAQTIANQNTGVMLGLTTFSANAECAIGNLPLINILNKFFAARNAPQSIFQLLRPAGLTLRENLSSLVKSAGKNTNRPRQGKTTFAVLNAKPNQNQLYQNVLSATTSFEQENIQKQDFVAPSVLESITVLEERNELVYDIEVDECHEYFANGILVHNCIDGVRYVVLSEITGIGQPQNLYNVLGKFA